MGAAAVVAAATVAARPATVHSSFSGYTLVEKYVDHDEVDAERMQRDLVLFGQTDRDRNEDVIRERIRLLLFSAVLLATEAVAFLMSAHQ